MTTLTVTATPNVMFIDELISFFTQEENLHISFELVGDMSIPSNRHESINVRMSGWGKHLALALAGNAPEHVSGTLRSRPLVKDKWEAVSGVGHPRAATETWAGFMKRYGWEKESTCYEDEFSRRALARVAPAWNKYAPDGACTFVERDACDRPVLHLKTGFSDGSTLDRLIVGDPRTPAAGFQLSLWRDWENTERLCTPHSSVGRSALPTDDFGYHVAKVVNGKILIEEGYCSKINKLCRETEIEYENFADYFVREFNRKML